MNWLEKVSEKLGIIEEEDYEEEELNTNVKDAPPFFKVKNVENTEMPVSNIKRIERSDNVEKNIDEKKYEDQEKEIKKEKKRKGFFSNGDKTDMDTVDAIAKAFRIAEVHPKNFDDSQKIADIIKDSQPVIVNFEGLDAVVTKRISDFVSGVVYAMKGNMRMINKTVLLCAPAQVDIDATDDLRE